jgi:hypothetical protein
MRLKKFIQYNESFDADNNEQLEIIYKTAQELIQKNNIPGVNLEMKEDYLTIKIVLPTRAKLTDLIRITSFLKSLDVNESIDLSELELWKSQKNEPMLIIDFYLNSPEDSIEDKYDDIPF